MEATVVVAGISLVLIMVAWKGRSLDLTFRRGKTHVRLQLDKGKGKRDK